MTEIAKPIEKPIEEPTGFGGWLILPVLGTFIAPVLFIFGILKDASIYGQLNAHFRMIANVEMTIFAVLAAVACCAIYFMLKKSAVYPKIYIGIMVANVASSLTVIALMGGFGAMGIQPFVSDLTRSVMAAVIWIPYMLVSKRVQNTFVN